MKKALMFLLFSLTAFVFAEETELFNSSASANLDGYDYITNFEVDSDSGYFVKGRNLVINSTADGVEAVAWDVPKYISTSYKVVPAYPSELNEANNGSGYIKNAAAIKSIKVVATVNRPYDNIFVLYSTTPGGDIKKIKLPHYDNTKSMIEQEYLFENPLYIDNVKDRDVKVIPLVGSHKRAIYFKGIQVQTNAPYGIYGYGDYSTINIKSIAVIYDKSESDESVAASEEFEAKYGIDPNKKIRENTIEKIKNLVEARENEKSLMHSSE